MGVIGAVFQPELIELMKAVLDDAAAMLPEAKRTSTMKAEIASHILACAAKGERDPTAIENRSPLSRRGVYSLFARYLSGAQGGLRQSCELNPGGTPASSANVSRRARHR